MKIIYSVLFITFFIHIHGMEYQYYTHNFFIQSDSDSFSQAFDPLEENLFQQQNKSTQQAHTKLHVAPLVKPLTRTIKIHKGTTIFWQRFIHMAASIFSGGKYIITPSKKP